MHDGQPQIFSLSREGEGWGEGPPRYYARHRNNLAPEDKCCSLFLLSAISQAETHLHR